MIRHIVVADAANLKRYETMFDQITLPKLKLPTSQAMNHFYQSEGLDR